MFYVATALLFDKNGKLLIYLRDNNPEISFPNYWDLFGGIIEEGETPEQALVREVKEELGIEIESFARFKEYESVIEEHEPNRKYVFVAHVNEAAEDLTLHDGGQSLKGIFLAERNNYKFANILGKIIDDFANIKTAE